ncbi:Gfo/Idh/MocA family protein [Evansella sp. AB-rgal1]|uniref:Gfo/Idh/MocA family protein n=1 Tax=Evansella sp. AB-rgal1 TaxID=3242696 RepID=UPI00359CD891
MKKMNVGIIGCGNISSIYMENIPGFPELELVACSDIIMEKAEAQAKKFNVMKACTVPEILDDPNIDIIVNLTTPQDHAEVCIQALQAGKHVHVEKPLAVTLEDGKKIVNLAQEKGLLVGGAPDTFLGAGIQTALQLIEQGEIGELVGASAFLIGRGHEHWHPDPEFYYDNGGGPMFDMGPYYLTTLIALLGPIRRLSGTTRITYPERTILSEPKAGKIMKVNTPTHISGTMDFQSGSIGTITTSFDAFGGSSLPPIEIYGSEGTLLVPDPNTFGGPVRLRKKGEQEFVEIPLISKYHENSRGLGVLDMARAILHGSPHRSNGELAYHVLEAMHGFHISSEKGEFYHMESSCEKPKAFDTKLHENTAN